MSTQSEPKLFLAPCRNEAARKHFQKTILSPIPKDLYTHHTDKDLGESVHLWGVRAGNERYWNQIRKNDILLFYPEENLYTHYARVIDIEENQNLGDLVCTSTEDRFRHLIFLHDPIEISIPSPEFHELIDYGRDYPINFTTVGENRLERIKDRYGSLQAYLIETAAQGPDADEDNLRIAREELVEATKTEPPLTDREARYKTTNERVRSAAFNVEVLEKYEGKCAVCGSSRKSPAGNHEVEAAHIFPRSGNGVDDIRNGIALCKLHHWAFDVGWFSITNDFELMIRDEPQRDGYDEFISLQGSEVRIPDQRQFQPHGKFLEKHREIHGFQHP